MNPHDMNSLNKRFDQNLPEQYLIQYRKIKSSTSTILQIDNMSIQMSCASHAKYIKTPPWGGDPYMTLRLSNLYSVIHPYVQDDARRVSREHRDVVTSTPTSRWGERMLLMYKRLEITAKLFIHFQSIITELNLWLKCKLFWVTIYIFYC